MALQRLASHADTQRLKVQLMATRIYKTMRIKGTTQLLGVIGYPVEHSFSPLMHNAAIAHLNKQGIAADFAYLPFPIAPESLEVAIAGFTAIGLRGFNITIPHKQTIIPLLDEVSEVARAIGAVNTVWRSEAGWSGTNTDAVGFLAPLKALNRRWGDSACDCFRQWWGG